MKPPTCTCDIFDIGPRCGPCVAACTQAGHPFAEHQTNGVHCFCGTPASAPEPCPRCGWQYDEVTALAARRRVTRVDPNPTHQCTIPPGSPA